MVACVVISQIRLIECFSRFNPSKNEQILSLGWKIGCQNKRALGKTRTPWEKQKAADKNKHQRPSILAWRERCFCMIRMWIYNYFQLHCS